VVDESRNHEAAARRFLSSGHTGGAELENLTAACDRLVRAETQRSLPRALELAKKFVKLTRANSDMSLQIALRSLGWASHCSGKYQEAEAAYCEARALVVRRPFDRAQIDKILIDVYMYLGSSG
jgi:hypothetical protein